MLHIGQTYQNYFSNFLRIFTIIIFIAIANPVNAQEPLFPPLSAETVNQFGGWINSAAAKGDNLYIAQGHVVNIVDISSPGYSRVGYLKLPTSSQNYAISGNYLFCSYLGDTYKGFLDIIDISDPANPSSISRTQLDGDIFIHKMYSSFTYRNYPLFRAFTFTLNKSNFKIYIGKFNHY